jgi:predicted HTH domain antitoxin
LLARAIRGYTEGALSAQAIATLRGVPLAEVEKELQEAGLVPAEPDDRQGMNQPQASAAEPAE